MPDVAAPRPSSAGRWCGGGCPGSVALAARYPETTNPAAENGTRLHGLAANDIRGAQVTHSVDDASAITPYVQDVLKEYHAREGSELRVEGEISWGLNPRLKGTPDAVLFDFQNKHLIIWDLKTGWRLVEALMNWQLLCYAAMLCPAKWTIELRIVQPLPYHRDGTVRSWTLTWTELMRLAVVIQDAFKEASTPDAPLRVGAHCLYCEALAACPAARDISLSAVEYAGGETVDLPDEHLGRELEILRDMSKILQLRTDALEEAIAAKLRAGARLPGLSMREGRGGRTNWEGDEAAIRSTLQVLTGKDYAEMKLPTPTQLKTLGVPEGLLKPFTTYKPGKMAVSTDAAHDANRIFGDTPNMEHTK